MRILAVFLFLSVFGRLSAQDRMIVYLTDKGNQSLESVSEESLFAPRSIQRRKKHNIPLQMKDLQVWPEYFSLVNSRCRRVLMSSRWLNAMLVEATEEQKDSLLMLSCVSKIEKVAKGVVQKETEGGFGLTFEQSNMLGLTGMHANGFLGSGVWIGVLDSGFEGVDSLPAFEGIFQSGRLLGTFDMVGNSASVFDKDDHGTMVLSLMAAQAQNFKGGAPLASYALFRTENNNEETIAEEFNIVKACEVADSIGIDIINISLGYTTFDDTGYEYRQLDGQTALSTRACNWASQAGMLVVVSAGNQGNKSWRYISAPADSDSVIAVGALTNSGELARFSGRGPSADGRIKPDVVAPGAGVLVINRLGNIISANGTSFAAPLVTSLAAGLLEAFPAMTSWELKRLILRTASGFSSPNDSTGFGIPNFMEAYSYILPNLLDNAERNRTWPPNPVQAGQRIFLRQFWEINHLLSAHLIDSQAKEIECHFDGQSFLIPEDLPCGIYIAQLVGKEEIKNFKLSVSCN